MVSKLTPPIGLVFGDDSELMRRLEERFGSSLMFKTARVSDCSRLHRMANIQVAIVLWRHDATTVAHRIQEEYPGIDVFVERNRRGFRSPIEQNGFAATFDKAESREDIVRQVESVFSAPRDAKVASEPVRQDARLNFEAFLTHLPQVTSMFHDESRLADTLLVALLGTFRSTQGGLYLWDNESGEFKISASRNMVSSAVDFVASASDFCSWLHQVQPCVILDSVSSPARTLFKHSGCNLILPVWDGNDLVGWFLAKVRGVFPESSNDLMQSISFFVGEALKQNRLHSHAERELNLWQEVCSKITEAAVWVDQDGKVKVLNDEEGLLAWKALSSKSHVSQLRSSELKSAVHLVQSGEKSVVTVAHHGPELQTRIESLSRGGVLLSVRSNSEKSPKVNFTAWRRMALLLLSEDLKSQNSRHPFLSVARDLISEASSKTTSVEWILEKLESEKRIKLNFVHGSSDHLRHLHLPCHSAGRLFLTLACVLSARTSPERLDLVLASNSRRGLLTVDVPVAWPNEKEAKEPLADLALLEGEVMGCARQNAAFGFRLSMNLASTKILTMSPDVSQAGDFVLQTPNLTPTNGSDAIRNGPSTSSTHSRRTAQIS